jgi:endonuclease YncB( thermonuclease family)
MKQASAWQRLIYATMLGGALLLQSCERPAVTPATETAMGSKEAGSPGPGALTGTVTHVRDGDTIEVAGKP